jgi:hypothetical protein
MRARRLCPPAAFSPLCFSEPTLFRPDDLTLTSDETHRMQVHRSRMLLVEPGPVAPGPGTVIPPMPLGPLRISTSEAINGKAEQFFCKCRVTLQHPSDSGRHWLPDSQISCCSFSGAPELQMSCQSCSPHKCPCMHRAVLDYRIQRHQSCGPANLRIRLPKPVGALAYAPTPRYAARPFVSCGRFSRHGKQGSLRERRLWK